MEQKDLMISGCVTIQSGLTRKANKKDLHRFWNQRMNNFNNFAAQRNVLQTTRVSQKSLFSWLKMETN